MLTLANLLVAPGQFNTDMCEDNRYGDLEESVFVYHTLT